MDPSDRNNNISQSSFETEVDAKQPIPQQPYVDPNQQYSQQLYVDPNQGAYQQQQAYVDPNQGAYQQQQAYVDPNQMAYQQQQAYVDPNQQAYYAPNPYGYTAQTGNYTYDCRNIQYQEMSVDQWNTIPCDQSDYSYYWADQQAFEPQKYSENKSHETKWNDVGFLIAFLIHLVITIGVLIYIVAAKKKEPESSTTTSSVKTLSSSTTEYNKQEFKDKMVKCLVIGLVVGFLVNVVHLIYIVAAPVVYIYSSFCVGFIVSIACIAYPMFKYQCYPVIVYPIFMLLFAIIFYIIYHEEVKFSAAFLKQTTLIIMRNYTIFLFVLAEIVVNAVVSIGFSFMVWLILYKNLSAVIYVYLFLSYYWIIYSLGYIMYVTGAGLGGTWYFLNGTEYYPSCPVWESFKRASTTSVGSSIAAGFWLALVQFCRMITRINLSNVRGNFAWIIVLIQLIALCILCIIECCFTWINRYALIYCALFGVPYREGCRRFAELSCSKFIDVLFDGSIVSTALTFNLFVFVIGGAFIGFGIGYSMDKDNSYFKTFSCVFALFFTMGFYLICDFPIETICDTLFICFAEAPEKLKTSANELYENCKDIYGRKIKKRMK